MDQPVGERAFSMIDLAYDTEIAEFFEICHILISEGFGAS
jgi:hypothetical protein